MERILSLLNWTSTSIVLLFLVYIILVGTRRAFPLFFIFCMCGWRLHIVGPLTVIDVLIFVFIIMGLKIIQNNLTKKTYPFIFVSILSIISYFLSAIFAAKDPHWPYTILTCWRSLGLPILFFSFITDSSEIKRLFKHLFTAILIISASCILEVIIGNHLWFSLIRFYIDPEYGFDMGMNIRYGMSRVQSFFPQPISLGYCGATLFSFMLFFQKNIKSFLSVKAIKLCLILLLICSFLSTSRVAIVAIISTIILYSKKKILNPKYWIFSALLVVLAFLFFSDYFYTIIQSVINSENTEGGSSIALRTGQLEVCLLYFAQSPIVGLGTYAIFDIVGKYNSIILGAESIWFFLLVNHGLLGCFSYVCFYIKSMFFIPRWKWECFSILIVQLFFNTFTSIPGFDVGFMLCIMLFIKKLFDIQSHQIEC